MLSFFHGCLLYPPLRTSLEESHGQSCSSLCFSQSISKEITGSLEIACTSSLSLHRSPIQNSACTSTAILLCTSKSGRLERPELYADLMCSSPHQLACLLLQDASSAPRGRDLSLRSGLSWDARHDYLSTTGRVRDVRSHAYAPAVDHLLVQAMVLCKTCLHRVTVAVSPIPPTPSLISAQLVCDQPRSLFSLLYPPRVVTTVSNP